MHYNLTFHQPTQLTAKIHCFIQNRIHIACSAGLPVSITELSVHATNVTLRADELEKAFYIYFSEECVNGILLWGFSDQSPLLFTEDSALTTGVDSVVR